MGLSRGGLRCIRERKPAGLPIWGLPTCAVSIAHGIQVNKVDASEAGYPGIPSLGPGTAYENRLTYRTQDGVELSQLSLCFRAFLLYGLRSITRLSTKLSVVSDCAGLLATGAMPCTVMPRELTGK